MSLCPSEDLLFSRGAEMKKTEKDAAVDAVMVRKYREDRITNCCDIFKGIVRNTKVFMLVQLVIYLLLAYSLFMGVLGARKLIRPVVCTLFPLAGAAVTIVKRNKLGNIVGAGIDVASIAVILFFRMMELPEMILILASLVVHAVRAEKIYCYDLIKDLYGFSRFYSFDICNRVADDDFKAQSILESYDSVFDNELMKYERSSHYIPPLFKRIQTAAVCALIVGTVALTISMAVLGKARKAEEITELGSRKGGSVKGSVTQIFDMKSHGSGLAEDEYWVPMGGEQVCFVVPGEYRDSFRALYVFCHPDKQGSGEFVEVKPKEDGIKFTGEICKVDTSEYAESDLRPAPQMEQRSDLPFNTKYYIKLYSTGLWNIIQTVGIVLIVIGAAAWAVVIFIGSRENNKY